MGYMRSHHGRRSDPSWRTIVVAILVGLIVARMVSTGFARRAVAALLARTGWGAPVRERLPGADAVPQRKGVGTETTSRESSVDRVDLTTAGEQVTSEVGPALDDIASGEAEPHAGSAVGSLGSDDNVEERPLSVVAQELAAESDLPDSVPADGTSVCPVEYPIKGNGRSGIYHPPGAFAYERTVPSICFRTVEAAERGGFRPARH